MKIKLIVDLEDIFVRDVGSRYFNREEPALWLKHMPIYVSWTKYVRGIHVVTDQCCYMYILRSSTYVVTGQLTCTYVYAYVALMIGDNTHLLR